MNRVDIDSPDDPRLTDYRGVSDPELLRQGEIFIAEGRQVVRTLLEQSRYEVRSLLVTPAVLEALREPVEAQRDSLTVYVVAPGLIEALSGYNIHRGCLGIGLRRRVLSVRDWLRSTPPEDAHLFVALERMANADNVGGIFRNAAAFGAGAVLLSPGCCDPLYRKSIRVSMGAALQVPFVAAASWPDDLGVLRDAGCEIVALTPRPGALSIGEFARARRGTRPVVLVAGTEGAGLSDAATALADVSVSIPMVAGVDSLNVATATGIALHRLARLE